MSAKQNYITYKIGPIQFGHSTDPEINIWAVALFNIMYSNKNGYEML